VDGISNVMAFAAHERRHLDGSFTHRRAVALPVAATTRSTFSSWRRMAFNGGWRSAPGSTVRSTLESVVFPGLIWQDSNFTLGMPTGSIENVSAQPPALSRPANPGGACPPAVPVPDDIHLPPHSPRQGGSAYSQDDRRQWRASPYTFASRVAPCRAFQPEPGGFWGDARGGREFSFTVEATDAAGCTSSRSYTLSAKECMSSGGAFTAGSARRRRNDSLRRRGDVDDVPAPLRQMGWRGGRAATARSAERSRRTEHRFVDLRAQAAIDEDAASDVGAQGGVGREAPVVAMSSMAAFTVVARSSAYASLKRLDPQPR